MGEEEDAVPLDVFGGRLEGALEPDALEAFAIVGHWILAAEKAVIGSGIATGSAQFPIGDGDDAAGGIADRDALVEKSRPRPAGELLRGRGRQAEVAVEFIIIEGDVIIVTEGAPVKGPCHEGGGQAVAHIGEFILGIGAAFLRIVILDHRVDRIVSVLPDAVDPHHLLPALGEAHETLPHHAVADLEAVILEGAAGVESDEGVLAGIDLLQLLTLVGEHLFNAVGPLGVDPFQAVLLEIIDAVIVEIDAAGDVIRVEKSAIGVIKDPVEVAEILLGRIEALVDEILPDRLALHQGCEGGDILEHAEADKTDGSLDAVADRMDAGEIKVAAGADPRKAGGGEIGVGEPLIPADHGIAIFFGSRRKTGSAGHENLPIAGPGRAGEFGHIRPVDEALRRKTSRPDPLTAGAENDRTGVEGMNALVEGVGAGTGTAMSDQIEAGEKMLNGAAGDAGGPLKHDAREGARIGLRAEAGNQQPGETHTAPKSPFCPCQKHHHTSGFISRFNRTKARAGWPFCSPNT
ncbi:MAG: hypothetical protein BWY77_01135 [bacterium ADurb.Bin431]|nr:MAG: hypothetical protein BWY77_01135 [bacterium ADurb.Bin431]